MSNLTKHRWLLPLFIVATLPFLGILLFLTREPIICASLGDWAAVRNYAVLCLLFIAGLALLAWGYAVIRAQKLTPSSVTVLTWRHGRLVIPWTSVQRATFRSSAALLHTGQIRARIGFAMYQDYREAEAFARQQLSTAGAVID